MNTHYFWKRFLIGFASTLGVVGAIALIVKLCKPKMWVIELQEKED